MADENVTPEVPVADESVADLDVRSGTTGVEAPPETPVETPFIDSVPDRFKDRGYWKNVNSQEQLFEQFDNLQRYRGDSYKVPGQDANDEDWNAVYSRLGRPETPDDYEIVMRDGGQDRDGNPTIQWDDSAEPWIRNTAHEIGLNPRQTQKLIDRYSELLLAGHTQAMQERHQRIDELKNSMGDLYERKLTLGHRAMQKVGGEEFVALMQQTGLDTHPAVISAMLSMGQQFEESGFIDGRVGSMDRSSAGAKLAAIDNDMSHPYWNREDPGHKDALKEYETLSSIFYGDGAPTQRIGGVIPID